MHPKLFIPGPVEVQKDLLYAQTKPMIGHRSPEYSELHKSVITKMKKFLEVDTYEVFVFASSSTGVMEAAIRNCVKDKVLHTVCGAFSKRWTDISEGNGKSVTKLEVAWGKAIKPESLRKSLAEEESVEAVTITHNETSTGVMNPLEELVKVVKEDRERLVFVDAVSSCGGTVIEPEKLGIDVLVFGTQKCFGLPPGLAFAVVSERAMDISSNMKNKGYYFDFHVMKKYNDKWQTPATPAISLMNALDTQLDRMLGEDMKVRAARHTAMADKARTWCTDNGFELFAEEGYRSDTVTAVTNTPGVDIAEFRSKLKNRGYIISDGYGKLKGQGFRIGHMADWKESDLEELLRVMSEVIKEL